MTRAHTDREQEHERSDRGVEQEIASGRKASTPFALTGMVALVVWSVAALIAAILFLVIWLA
jgi:hypothetical protein